MDYLPVLYKENVSFSVGSSVTIKGTPIMPFSLSPELQVDFYTGTEESSDIAFSFRVHFGNCVVMNSRKNGTWGQEVKSTDMPFRDGQPFDLEILVLSNEYQVTANGAQYYNFPRQPNSASVRMIHVWRDVSLTSVTPQEKRM